MSIRDIKTFMSSIQKIEGPIYAALLTPYSEYSTFPVILNLGDMHFGQEFCYPSCHTTDKCLSLESLSFFDALSKFASENKIIVDFFF